MKRSPSAPTWEGQHADCRQLELCLTVEGSGGRGSDGHPSPTPERSNSSGICGSGVYFKAPFPSLLLPIWVSSPDQGCQ
jgi:hypothetical protein